MPHETCLVDDGWATLELVERALTAMSDPTNDLARTRIRQVFKFLEAFNARRNPVATQIGEQPHILFRRDMNIVHGNLTLAEFADPDPGVEEGDESGDVVLRVRRVELEPAPPPPDDVAMLLQESWENPEIEPTLPADPSGAGLNRPVDWLAAREALDQWLPSWREWADGVVQAYRVNEVFNYLFDIRSEMDREAERFELVAGDGILNWRLESGGVDFPLLIQRLQIDYDAALPEFRISESERPPELNAGILRRAGVDGRIVSELITRCQSELASPFGADRTSMFLRSLAATIARYDQILGMGRGEEGQAALLLVVSMIPSMKRLPASTWGMS